MSSRTLLLLVWMPIVCWTFSVPSAAQERKIHGQPVPQIPWSRASDFYTIGGDGRLRAQNYDNVSAREPMIDLLSDAGFADSIGIPAQRMAQIEDIIARYSDEREKLRRNLDQLTDQEEKRAVYDRYLATTERMERQLRTKLSPRQQALCDAHVAAVEFYRLGPVEFAKSRGLPADRVEAIRRRSIDVAPKLAAGLREIELRLWVEIAEATSSAELKSLIQSLEGVSPARSGVVSTLFHSLHSIRDLPLANLPSPLEHNMPAFALAPAGYMTRAREFSRADYIELVEIFSVQSRDLSDLEQARAIAGRRFEDFVHLEQQYSRLRRELAEELRAASPAERADIEQRIYIERLHHSLAVLNLRDEVESEFPAHMADTLRRANLIMHMQRLGPVEVIFSKLVDKVLPERPTARQYDLVKSKSAELIATLQSRCQDLQREIVEEIFQDMGEDAKEYIDWIELAYPFAVPPLELLLAQCRQY